MEIILLLPRLDDKSRSMVGTSQGFSGSSKAKELRLIELFRMLLTSACSPEARATLADLYSKLPVFDVMQLFAVVTRDAYNGSRVSTNSIYLCYPANGSFKRWEHVSTLCLPRGFVYYKMKVGILILNWPLLLVKVGTFENFDLNDRADVSRARRSICL